MRLATWNVNSLRVRLAQLLAWLAEVRPDAMALQETKLADEGFPHTELREAGYAAVCSGQPTYNGVAILARVPPTDVACGLPGFAQDPQRRLIATTVGSLRVASVYVPNGQRVGSDKYLYKLRWYAALREWVLAELAAHPRLVVMGDFNVAPTDADVHDPARWAGEVLCSQPERAALAALAEAGLVDAYRHCLPDGREYTWWDYRAGSFRRNAGLRIDHVLVSPALVPALRACAVDVAARRAERPSDHAPVVVDLTLD
jgi:exodeoxyribonuclease III